MSSNPFTRRSFLAAGATVAAAAKLTILEPFAFSQQPTGAPSDRIRVAFIGTGVRGCELLMAYMKAPNVECVGISDLYDGRLTAAHEYLGRDVPLTKDYRTLLDRKDVDAVVVAAPDHQHLPIVLDALSAGKDVYCEKPMTHKPEEGRRMIEAVERHGRVMQVGSQRVSSALFVKAKEIYDSGRLGEVYAIEGFTDRNAPGGAWVYPIAPDANPQTIDWKRWLGDAPQIPFDPVRFFRWRCYKEYGEGLPGDLFVHLLSGIMFVTGTTEPALRAQSTGGLFRYKDGRDFPDLHETFYDYPNFRVTIRCNLNSDAGEKTIFYGTRGIMTIGWSDLRVQYHPVGEAPEMYALIGWPKKNREDYLATWSADHPNAKPPQPIADEAFALPHGYNDTLVHEQSFFDAVRSRKQPVENVHFGNSAAIGCHLANASYFAQGPARWDTAAGRIVT